MTLNYALEEYLPSKVVTIILSPCSMNIGTLTTKPVSKVTSFKALFAVLPATAGLLSVTSKAIF